MTVEYTPVDEIPAGLIALEFPENGEGLTYDNLVDSAHAKRGILGKIVNAVYHLTQHVAEGALGELLTSALTWAAAQTFESDIIKSGNGAIQQERETSYGVLNATGTIDTDYDVYYFQQPTVDSVVTLTTSAKVGARILCVQKAPFATYKIDFKNATPSTLGSFPVNVARGWILFTNKETVGWSASAWGGVADVADVV